VSGHPSKLFTSGKAAFRFLIPRKAAEADPLTAKVCERGNELAIWYGADRRVVMYPCDSNELLNFVCIHPEGESRGGADGKHYSSTFHGNTLLTPQRVEQGSFTREHSKGLSGL
jgi:hypothetical protein